MNDSPPDPALRSRILEAVSREPSPTGTEVRRRSSLLLFVFVVLVLGEFLLVGGIRDGGMPRTPLQIVATVTGLVVAAGVATHLVFRRRNVMLGRPARHMWLVIIVTPVVLFLWKVLWSSAFEGGLDPWQARVGHRCLGLLMTMGVLLTVGYSFALRGEFARPVVHGAMVGVAAGATAAVLLELWCPVGHPMHVLYGHIGPISITSLFGAVLAYALDRS